MKQFKKYMCLLVTLVMVFSLMPVSAFAADETAGTTTNGAYDANGNWAAGGTGSVTHDVNGTNVTLSKTATAVEGMENTYDITLQVKTSTTTSTHTNSGAVVLVIDVSGSMNYCADCGGESRHDSDCPKNTNTDGWRGSEVQDNESRIIAAIGAASTFLESYAGDNPAADRQLSIVTFSTGYQVHLGWTNVAGVGSEGYNKAYSYITSLGANGGTNLEGGLYTALNQLGAVSDYGSKSVVLLTDGVPTYRINGGNGSQGSAQNNSAAASRATSIKNSGATLYTVCFGVANETTYNGGPTVGNFLSDSVASSGCAYNADNTSELYGAFAAITESITSGLSGDGWTATDPMAQGITVTSGTGENFYGSGGTYTWKLDNLQTTTDGSTTYYTYTYTYRVTFDPQFEGFVEGDYYPTNEQTYLNVDGEQYAFPVPGVKGVLPRTDVSVTKVWNDGDNQDGIRPESVTVQLMEGETPIGEPVVLNADNNWSHTWDGDAYNLIAKSEGVDHVYTVVETNVPGDYTASVSTDGFAITLTNTHQVYKKDITVTKAWSDADNQDGIRPESIKVNLLADGAVVATAELTAANGWTYTFTGLDVNKAGSVKTAVVYTVEEAEVPEGYTASVNGLTITNTHEVAKTSVPVTKVWDDADNQDGIRPTSVTVKLLADGKETGKSLTLNSSNSWSGTFSNLDMYAAGQKIAYTVEEVSVTGYTTAITGDAANGYTITNSHTPAVITIDGSKTWDDNNNQDGKRPESITIRLYADGKEVGSRTVTATNGWKWSFTDLPEFAAGTRITYTITEDAVAGYTSAVNGFDVTNTHQIEKISISGAKTWDDNNNQDGKRPESITINLLANGEVVKTVTVTAENGWTWSFTDLDKYAGGKEIVYTITEGAVEGYETNVNGFDVTNTHETDKTSVSVTKVWDDAKDQDGKRPESVTVHLFADGVDTGKTLVLNAENNWTGSFTDLEVYAKGKEGVAVVYTITEDAVAEYTTAITGDAATGFTVTNSHTPETTQIPVYKTWADDGDRDGIRPQSVTINLLSDGEIVKTATITATVGEDGKEVWTYTFTELPVYKAGAVGQKIVYTVEEVPVEGYTASWEGNTVTNTHAPELIDISGAKTWNDADNQDGIRPASIIINLMNGEKVVATKTVTAADNWAWTFEDQFKYENGKEIVYTVVEVAVDGYTTTYDGFNVTNTHTPETIQVAGSKIWNDNNNQDGKRPASITINLLSDGEVIKTVTVTEADGWAWSFTDLPKYRDEGKEIVYTITEDAVAEYTTEVDGYNVTNTHEIEKTQHTVAKSWVDDNNRDALRTANIVVQLYADGVAKGEPVVLNAENNWTYTWTELDVYNAGEVVDYSVKEVAVPTGYEASYTEADGKTTITNTHQIYTTDVTVNKIWVDENNQDGIRPEKITVQLYANGVECGEPVELTAETGWTYTWTGLTLNENGAPIVYTVKELNVATDYEASVDGLEITNTHKVYKTAYTVTKIWNDDNNRDGIRPGEIAVQLYANGEAFGEAVVLTAETEWTYTWTDLDLNAEGEKIVYTVKEVQVPEGYTSQVVDNVITNTHAPQLTQVTVNKVWADQEDQDGIRPEEITVQLYADGVAQGEPVTVTAENLWTYTFTDLLKYRDGGEEIVYTVEELNVAEGYVATVKGFEITNTHQVEKTTFTVNKVWNDDNNRDGLRPDAIKVQLFANGKALGTVVKITEEMGWTYTWTDLDKNAGGEPIVYTVEEVDVNTDYVATVAGNVITNTHEIAKLDMKIDKVWVGEGKDAERPDAITVQLYANGKAVGNPVKITAEGGWTYTFTDLPVNENGKQIKYTVVETAVDGYTTKYTPNDTGITITNMYKDIPDTGDRSNTMLWGAMMVIGLGMLMMAFIPEKKKH